MAIKHPQPAARPIGRLLTLVVIGLLAALFSYLGPRPGMAGSTMLLGFLLLAAFGAGELARELRLPRITGYLVIGILFGPHVLGLLPEGTVSEFRLINGVALSVIALQAGGELKLKNLAARFRGIAAITLSQIVIIMGGVASVAYLGRGLFPFLGGQGAGSVLAIALIFGLVAVAKSPATTIAVITEQRGQGPVTDTVLGVSVLKDVVILIMIAVVVPLALVLADPQGSFDFSHLGDIAFLILASLVAGAGVGLLIGLYLSKVRFQPILFVLAVAFGLVELSHALGFESEGYILMSMAAGFVVQNFSVQGPRFVEALEANSLPIYALFFAVAGADLKMNLIPVVWRAGVVLVLARIGFIYASTYLAALASGESTTIRHYAWMGFLAQAGVTLGLANIVSQRFPTWGAQVSAIIVAMIAVNQLIGPPLFRLALVRSGESHAA